MRNPASKTTFYRYTMGKDNSKKTARILRSLLPCKAIT
jgi:hypothetical protein